MNGLPINIQANPMATCNQTQNNNNPNITATLAQNNNIQVKSCAGCGARICDRYLLHAVDRYWHTGCLKCSCCQAHLGEIGTSCFAKRGMILCKNDYIRMFGSSGTCAACGQSIPASEFVMKAQTNVYHLKCFTCVSCHNQLQPGDRFGVVNGSLFCEQDYPKVLKGSTGSMRGGHKRNKLSNVQEDLRIQQY
ncbi:LIM domain transcription factor LMO4.1-like isoform X2 [Tubulanus polymorphus]|uniref:LIM domain transcription factor LMO4.1-like isoform X2 n=1 Tax=Tubulanus polymorphus TaxID=672921 RepID=UPI003DA20AF7